MDILRLPKTDLHCHLDGSMSLSLVRELLNNSAIQEEELQVHADCQNLAEYLEKFELPVRALQTERGLRKAAYELVGEVKKENVRYLEVRFAPMLSVSEGLSCRAVLESVIKGLDKAYKDFGVHANVIVCAMRHHSPEINIEMLRIAREMLGEGVCALDLAGDEAAFANDRFSELFRCANNLDMPFTIHSGECGSVQNVRSALAMGARRIGHGIALVQDESLQKEYARRRIGVEMCPTSNIQTKAVESWDTYPLLDFLKNGIAVSVNTDNRTVSGTSVTRELELIYESSGRDDRVINKLLRNALETSFAADDIKHRLWQEL